jgi:anti-anti-sigma regulatory factor
MAVPTGGTCCFTVRAPLRRSDIPGLRGRVGALLAATQPTTILCDASGLAPDAVAVDALARLQLVAARHGARIWLIGTPPALRGLLRLVGLDDVLPDAPEALTDGT